MREVFFPRRRLFAMASAYGVANIIGRERLVLGQSMTSPAKIRIAVQATDSLPGHGLGAAHNDVGALLIDGLQGTTVNVSNSSQLSNALSAAQPGDHIVLANGTYSGPFALSVSGTKANPIVIRSASPHGAVITGSLSISGSWGIASRLRADRISVTGNDSRASRCYVGSSGIYVANGNRITIDYNEVRDYSARGIWCRPSASASEMMNVWVHHNYIVNGLKSGNTSALNFTAGAWEATPKIHNALVEYNLAEGCKSTTTIGTKCSGNTYRFNTCRNNSEGFAQRHGHSNTWIGNSCVNSRGLTLCGKDHKIIGNYSDASSGNWNDIAYFWGNATSDTILQFVADNPNTGTVYERAENCVAIGNIGAFRFGGGSSDWGLPALNNEIRAHTGTVVLVSGRHSGTIDQRNDPPGIGIEVPQYVILQPSDVGPGAP